MKSGNCFCKNHSFKHSKVAKPLNFITEQPQNWRGEYKSAIKGMFCVRFQNQSPTFGFQGDHVVGFQNNLFLKPRQANLSCEESPSVLYELTAKNISFVLFL